MEFLTEFISLFLRGCRIFAEANTIDLVERDGVFVLQERT